MDALDLFNELDARTDDEDAIHVTAEDIDNAPLLFVAPASNVIDMTRYDWRDDEWYTSRIIEFGSIPAVRSW